MIFKKLICYVLCLFFCYASLAQSNSDSFRTYYRNIYGSYCDSSQAYSYTKLPKELSEFSGDIKEYYISNNAIKRSIPHIKGKKDGTALEFYSNGQKKSSIPYVNDTKQGAYTKWHNDQNSSILEKGSYIADSVWMVEEAYNRSGKQILTDGNGLLEHYYDSGVVRSLSFFKDKLLDGKHESFFDDGNLSLLGQYRSGKKIGNWVGYYKSGTKYYQEKYDETGNLIDGKSWRNGKERSYKKLETPAYPEYSMNHFRTHLASYCGRKYPLKAKREQIQGTVFINFYIDKKGKPQNIKVLKGIGGGCDEVGMKAIKSYGKWIPAFRRGQPVKQQFSVPIVFKINK